MLSYNRVTQGVEEAAQLGWSESRRRFFHPDIQRWANGFLAVVRLAARSGHFLADLPLELQYMIIDVVAKASLVELIARFA
jgi:hypothetical protein